MLIKFYAVFLLVIGQYQSKLGAKNRVAFPSKFRGEMGSKLIITRGYEGCLVIVDEGRWKQIAREIVDGTFVDRKIRDAGRFLLAGASEVECDDQGRFVIPVNLVRYAELNNEVIFVGLVNWVEIWSQPRWEEQEDYVSENSENIAQEIADIFNRNSGSR